MENSNLVPVPKIHMFDQVYDYLLEQITSGAVAPGVRIKDGEWATKLGVSRTPVREAMRKLSQEGLVTSLANGGYQIRQLTKQELVDLYRCRAALESAAVREVAASATAETISLLESVIAETDSAIERKDLDQAFELNSKFHAVLIDASHNSFLKNLLSSLQRMIKFYRKTALSKAKSEDAETSIYVDRLLVKQGHHRLIAAAVSSHNSELAAKLMHDHVAATVEDLTDSLALYPSKNVSRFA